MIITTLTYLSYGITIFFLIFFFRTIKLSQIPNFWQKAKNKIAVDAAIKKQESQGNKPFVIKHKGQEVTVYAKSQAGALMNLKRELTNQKYKKTK